MDVFLQTLEGWVYIVPIHGPLDGPLYIGSHIHQHCGFVVVLFTNLLLPNIILLLGTVKDCGQLI